MTANTKYGLANDTGKFSFAAGRRTMCRSVGLKPDSSGCASTLRSADWDKSKGKDAAVDILCEAGILAGVDCTYFKSGGELKDDGAGINLGMLFLGLFILMALIIGVYFLIKKFRKK